MSLAAFVESHGAQDLLSLLQRFAAASAATSKDEQVPEADEVLLELLVVEPQMLEMELMHWLTESL